MLFETIMIILFGLTLINTIRMKKRIAELEVKNTVLKNEADGYRMGYDLLEDRLEMIAKYVNADDYIDSIGPILTEIDRLKGEK